MRFEISHLGYLAPYLILTVTGMLLVLAEAFYRGKDRSSLTSLAVLGSLASALASVLAYRHLGDGPAVSLVGDMAIADRTAYVLSPQWFNGDKPAMRYLHACLFGNSINASVTRPVWPAARTTGRKCPTCHKRTA